MPGSESTEPIKPTEFKSAVPNLNTGAEIPADVKAAANPAGDEVVSTVPPTEAAPNVAGAPTHVEAPSGLQPRKEVTLQQGAQDSTTGASMAEQHAKLAEQPTPEVTPTTTNVSAEVVQPKREKVGWFKRLFGGKKQEEVVIKGPLPEALKSNTTQAEDLDRPGRVEAVAAARPVATRQDTDFINRGGTPPPGVEYPPVSAKEPDSQEREAA